MFVPQIRGFSSKAHVERINGVRVDRSECRRRGGGGRALRARHTRPSRAQATRARREISLVGTGQAQAPISSAAGRLLLNNSRICAYKQHNTYEIVHWAPLQPYSGIGLPDIPIKSCQFFFVKITPNFAKAPTRCDIHSPPYTSVIPVAG